MHSTSLLFVPQPSSLCTYQQIKILLCFFVICPEIRCDQVGRFVAVLAD